MHGHRSALHVHLLLSFDIPGGFVRATRDVGDVAPVRVLMLLLLCRQLRHALTAWCLWAGAVLHIHVVHAWVASNRAHIVICNTVSSIVLQKESSIVERLTGRVFVLDRLSACGSSHWRRGNLYTGWVSLQMAQMLFEHGHEPIFCERLWQNIIHS